MEKRNSHPSVYVGLGGHASYPFPGITSWSEPPFDDLKYEDNLELHKGYFSDEESTLTGTPTNEPVYYLPHGGTLDLNHDYKWLLYSGEWGEDGKAPRGLIFQDVDVGHPRNSGIGDRWLDPWEWSKDFATLDSGKYSGGKWRNNNVLVGYSDSPEPLPLKTKEPFMFLERGGYGKNTYVVDDLGHPKFFFP